MSNKYEKFDNGEFGLLPAEHENVNISKQKNGLRSGRISANQLRDHYSDDKCAVEIITNCNGGKKHLNSQTAQPNRINEFDPNNQQSLSFNQRKWRFHLERFWFRIFSILIIITYCILSVYTVLIVSKDEFTSRVHHVTTFYILDLLILLITFYFNIEIWLRIFASGNLTCFLANWYNSLDFVIIMIDLLYLISEHILAELPPSIRLVCFGRLVRVYVLINLLRNNEKTSLFKPSATGNDQQKDQFNIEITKREDINESNSQTNNLSTPPTNSAFNSETSKVKRSIKPDDFKLDLIYIKDNLMIIPFLRDNLIKFKRRNLPKNLESFLDSKYGSTNYKVYNLCSEQTYMDKSKIKFFHGNYQNFPVEDHGVLTINMLKEFVTSLDTYLQSNPSVVAVVHCSDDLGRTSLVICAWLLYKKYYNKLEDAQRFFYKQLKPNDKSSNVEQSENFNLLQTPSQLRYLKYFEKFISADMQRPSERKLHLNEIRISSIIGIGQGNGSDLYCVLQINQFEQFHMNFFQGNSSDQFNTNLNCKTTYNSEQDILTICPVNCPLLTGDILVKFFCRSKSVPKPHQHCAFYFTFNTDYLDETQVPVLRLDRTQLDNAHEPQLHTIYRERFAVELIFET